VLSGFPKLAIISTASKLVKSELNLITDMTNEPLYYLEKLERLKKSGLSPKESYDKIRKKSWEPRKSSPEELTP
jgi:hypothetical protein